MPDTPFFFSVTQNSVGRGGSAVRTQFLLDGGAAADIFVAAKIPGEPAGFGTNLLFIDEAEIGLMPTDDLDALILWVCPEFRSTVASEIMAIASGLSGAPMTADSTFDRPGMTVSITKYLSGSIPPGCIRVGFSVTTDAVGMENTAVDFESGPVGGGPGAISSAPGDIYYAVVTGAPSNPNYLWYEAEDLGLDPGTWVNGASTNLAALSDNLDALDSSPMGVTVGVIEPPGLGGSFGLELAPALPNPFQTRTTIPFTLPRAGRVRLTIHDVAGRHVATLVDAKRGAGRTVAIWDGRDSESRGAPVGIYIVRLEFEGRIESRRLVLIR